MFPQVKGLTRETEKTSVIFFIFLFGLQPNSPQGSSTATRTHFSQNALATSDSIVRPIELYFPETNFRFQGSVHIPRTPISFWGEWNTSHARFFA